MSGPIWKVVGGGDKGGIVVRTGKDVATPMAASRLATGAFVRQLELDGDRLKYQLLTSDGPESGWVGTQLKDGRDLLVPAEDVWEVIGGGDKGGIVVRTGVDVSSPQCANRLSTGAIIRETEVEGDRVKYERLTGTGPAVGWVSTKLAGGKDLLARGGKPVGAATVSTSGPTLFAAVEAVVKASELGEDVKAELEVGIEEFLGAYMKRLHGGEIVGPMDTYIQRLMSGNDPKGGAPGRPPRGPDDPWDTDFEARREAAERNREAFSVDDAKAPLAPPPWQRIAKPNLLKVAPQTLSGNLYGIPIPPTLGELEKLGPEWLTKALHAAGTLEADNAVTKVTEFRRLPTSTKDAAGGAGPKAILSVEYARPDPGLHARLFVKMPWAVEGGTKEMGVDVLNRVGAGDDYQEQAVYRFMGPLFPFKVPKYYFADVCRENNNSILITEAVAFGKKGQAAFEPYESLPLCEKYFDFQLDSNMQVEVYYCLMRQQARLAAWYQLGFFDKVPQEALGSGMRPPPVGSFQWPSQLNEKQRENRKRGAKLMVDTWSEFLDLAKRCYPADLTDKKFLSEVYGCIEDVCTYQSEVSQYFHLFPDYIALQHPNLNADNAYFWRNSEGQLDCGIFDWGQAAPINVIQLMTGSLTGAEGHVQDEHDVHWLQCFRDEYRRECGIRLDLGEMRRQWHLTYGIYLIYLAMRIRDSVFPQTPKEEWQQIASLWDKRAVDKWNVRCYTFMIGLTMRYLHLRWLKGGRKRLHIHDSFVEWRDYWLKMGMS